MSNILSFNKLLVQSKSYQNLQSPSIYYFLPHVNISVSAHLSISIPFSEDLHYCKLKDMAATAQRHLAMCHHLSWTAQFLLPGCWTPHGVLDPVF